MVVAKVRILPYQFYTGDADSTHSVVVRNIFPLHQLSVLHVFVAARILVPGAFNDHILPSGAGHPIDRQPAGIRAADISSGLGGGDVILKCGEEGALSVSFEMAGAFALCVQSLTTCR